MLKLESLYSLLFKYKICFDSPILNKIHKIIRTPEMLKGGISLGTEIPYKKSNVTSIKEKLLNYMAS